MWKEGHCHRIMAPRRWMEQWVGCDCLPHPSLRADSSRRNHQLWWWLLRPAGYYGQNERATAFYIFLFSEALSQPIPREKSKARDKSHWSCWPFQQRFNSFPSLGWFHSRLDSCKGSLAETAAGLVGNVLCIFMCYFIFSWEEIIENSRLGIIQIGIKLRSSS